jgi:NTP pyrophosphatase (non-canonical NTP hydrolase)
MTSPETLKILMDSEALLDELGEPVAPPVDLAFAALAAISRTRAARWHPGGIEEWAVERWSNAMAGEAGEACNAVKKLNRIEDGIASLGEKGREYTEREEAIAKVLEELADVVIYADLLAQRVGGNLAAAVTSKFNVVSERYGFPERLP